MFQFANPHILWLLVVIPVMIAILMIISYRNRRSLAVFGNPAILKDLMPDISPWRVKIKSILFLTGNCS